MLFFDKYFSNKDFFLPDRVRLEASTLCQLDCPACSMRRKNYGTLGKGYLKFQDFKKFIDRHPFIREIELSNYGEIFLNPELLEIIKYAYEKRVTLIAENGCNFNAVSEEMLEALVKYQFHCITCSIDGASQEIYVQYRRNGSFQQVIANICKLNEYKKQYSSHFPELFWQYVLMRHNEEDVVKAKQLASLLNMRIFFRLTWEKNHSLKNISFLAKETGLKYFSRESHLEKTNQVYDARICNQLWDTPQINWDGRLLGCCTVNKSDFGVNVFQVGLEKALKTKNYFYAKEMLSGNYFPSEITQYIPCTTCNKYKYILETKNFVQRLDLLSHQNKNISLA